jgi:hypothetical protein
MPDDPEDDSRPEIVAEIEMVNNLYNLLSAQGGILDIRQLMPLFIRHLSVHQVSVFYQVVKKLGSRERMGYGNLYRLPLISCLLQHI